MLLRMKRVKIFASLEFSESGKFKIRKQNIAIAHVFLVLEPSGLTIRLRRKITKFQWHQGFSKK
jgi:hypothetical protein